jgi:hypothetical protein
MSVSRTETAVQLKTQLKDQFYEPSAQRLSGECRHLNSLRKFAALCHYAATPPLP